MAPTPGLEPGTDRLTADSSAIELDGNIKTWLRRFDSNEYEITLATLTA